MADYVYWFIAALVLFGLEMASGTFYLLVLGIALAIGGGAALIGLGTPLQFVFAALAAVTGTLLLRLRKSTNPDDAATQSLDIGQAVQILSWHDNGTARAHYRGAEWDAEAESPDTPRDATLYIKALRGSTLILTHRKP
ncbi:MAG: NfeD family protein [Sulfuricella sp.]|nr:NfeD family protein [Sulfuricella sp.]